MSLFFRLTMAPFAFSRRSLRLRPPEVWVATPSHTSSRVPVLGADFRGIIPAAKKSLFNTMHRVRLRAAEGPKAWAHLGVPFEGLWVPLTLARLVAPVSVSALEGPVEGRFALLQGRGLCAARSVPRSDAEKSELYTGETSLDRGVLSVKFQHIVPAGEYEFTTGCLTLSRGLSWTHSVHDSSRTGSSTPTG